MLGMHSHSKTDEPNFLRTGLWQRNDGRGLERFELRSSFTEWILRGTILVLEGSEPAEARYEIHCDNSWKTQSAQLSLSLGGAVKELSVTRKDGCWYENGQRNHRVSGSIDIDLAWSPSTNTLPIRRLQLSRGESSGSLRAAWVVFPELTLQPLEQEYRYMGDRRYWYASQQEAFHAELLVDEDGLVVTYGELWHRVH